MWSMDPVWSPPHWSGAVTHANTWDTVNICCLSFRHRLELPLPLFLEYLLLGILLPSGTSSYPSREITWTEKDPSIIWKEGKDKLSQHPNGALNDSCPIYQPATTTWEYPSKAAEEILSSAWPTHSPWEIIKSSLILLKPPSFGVFCYMAIAS